MSDKIFTWSKSESHKNFNVFVAIFYFIYWGKTLDSMEKTQWYTHICRLFPAKSLISCRYGG